METRIPGCFMISCDIREDSRGRFVKTFQDQAFKQMNLRTDWLEEYYSVSLKGVVRGMHFQHPPFEHAKLVYCLLGEVMDVVVDLRTESPRYGQYESFIISSKVANSLYIPSGVAHGFLSLSEKSIMQYKVTSEYSPEHEAGILWNSFGFKWPVDAPILSERDLQQPKLVDYLSPFVYE